MHARRAWVYGAVLAFGAPAASQGVRPESLRLHGGTYSTDCNDAVAPRLRIGAERLVIEHGPRRRTTAVVMDSFTSFGAAPTSPVPPGYVMEFIGDAFSFHVFEDKAGYYIQPGSYLPAAEPVIGRANMKVRFRRCTAPAL